MEGRSLIPVCFGIILLCGMFLMGQDTWELNLTCSDLDDDGYGFIASELCPEPYADCCDQEADVYPGAPELCDGRDNQCPGNTGYAEIDEGCDPTHPLGMAKIPSGCYDMGAGDYDYYGNPVEGCPVCISSFEMDYHEVTNGDYAACVNAGACAPKDLPWTVGSLTRWSYFGNPCYVNFPVVLLKWVDARNYCAWAGKRLPTSAEWEYAARGGLDGKHYPWGDTISGGDANYWQSGDPWDDETSPVTYYPPNGYGLYDMTGNVEEWVYDSYSSIFPLPWEPESDPPYNDPVSSVISTTHFIRGGSFINDPNEDNALFVAKHVYADFFITNNWLGFRCARSGDCVDEDHDGYGDPDSPDCIYSGLDCNDTNPYINPAAMEICDNVIDDDCDLLLDGADPECQ